MKQLIVLFFFLLMGCGFSAFAYEGESWTIENVPNPKRESVRHYVSDPDNILTSAHIAQIDEMLTALEDSLTIEVAVVALNSIGTDVPDDFAYRLFSYWGVGKEADDNGLLILLVLDQREITFKTGYGLEGVLPDIICHRIQQDAMLPYLKENDFDRGMVEGVRAVTQRLYVSDYKADGFFFSLGNLWEGIPLITRLCLLGIIGLVNVLTFFIFVRRYRPKDSTALEAIEIINMRKELTTDRLVSLLAFIPLWPALLAFVLWYFGHQRRCIRLQAQTCPHCRALALAPLPQKEIDTYLSPAEKLERSIGSAIYQIYCCRSCGEELIYTSAIDKGYERCPDCRQMTLKPVKRAHVVKKATYTSGGLSETEHECLFCKARYALQERIPRLSRSSDSDGSGRGGGSHGGSSSGGSSGGGSFGGGHSGGGGSSSRF